MALLPIQHVDSAVKELRYSVTELGMVGGMLPSNGEGIKSHLGDDIYWPIYEEAEKLGCCLAVHVGSLHHLGMDSFSTYYPVHAVGHPVGIMIQAAGMLSHGVFERFPNLRVGFLEGGATWVPFFMDRLDRSYHEGHLQTDADGVVLGGPQPGEKASEFFKRHVREGRIFVGFDCDDDGLGFAVGKAGRDAFLFGSDFPHEVFDATKCRHEIDELLTLRTGQAAPHGRFRGTRQAPQTLPQFAHSHKTNGFWRAGIPHRGHGRLDKRGKTHIEGVHNVRQITRRTTHGYSSQRPGSTDRARVSRAGRERRRVGL